MKRKMRRGGFSLIEVLVALTILAIGLLAVAKLQTSAINGLAFSRHLSTSTQLAQQYLEYLRSLPYSLDDQDVCPKDENGANIQSYCGSWGTACSPHKDQTMGDGVPGPWHMPKENPVNAEGRTAIVSEMPFFVRWRVERGSLVDNPTFQLPETGQMRITVQVIWWENAREIRAIYPSNAALCGALYNMSVADIRARRGHVVELETIRQADI